jgi:hypothetical protein
MIRESSIPVYVRVLIVTLPSRAKSNSKLYYDRQSVGQSVLVSGTHLGPANNFSPFFFKDSYWFAVVGPLRKEVGSVVLSRCRASPV